MPDFFDVAIENAKAVAAARAVGDRVTVGVQRVLDNTGAFHTRAMKKRFRPYSVGGAGTGQIQSRAGHLRDSFRWETRGTTLAEKELRVFSTGGKVAFVQEYGKTIRPRTRKFLTVPTLSALTPSGTLKGDAALVNLGGKWQTQGGERTFILRAKSGFSYVAVSRDGKPVALYRLKTEVVLQPRLGFRKTFDEQTAPYLRDQLAIVTRAGVS